MRKLIGYRRVTTNTPALFNCNPPVFTEHRPNPKILNVLIKMENDARSKYTINFTRKALTFLNKHTDLNNPETVKAFIANL